MQCGIISVELQTDKHYGFLCCAVLFVILLQRFIDFLRVSRVSKTNFPKQSMTLKLLLSIFMAAQASENVEKAFCKLVRLSSFLISRLGRINEESVLCKEIPEHHFQGNLSLNTIQFVTQPLSILHIKSAIRHSASKKLSTKLVFVNDIQDQKWHQVTIKE